MFAWLGTVVLRTTYAVGCKVKAWHQEGVHVAHFLMHTASTFAQYGIRRSLFIEQFIKIGIASCPVALITGCASGLAVGLQAYISFNRFGIYDFMGTIVALGMLRELGPVLTGLMVTSRCGSAMAAELAAMRVTEQIDALKTLSINTYAYLIVPRITACIVCLPLLSILASSMGMLSGYLLCVHGFHVNSHAYHSGIEHYVTFIDVVSGIIKACFFGAGLGFIGTYYGYYAKQGVNSIGQATTKSVATGSLMILLMNYAVSTLLFQIGWG